MLKAEQAKKNEFKNFTERERFLCDYASEIMMIAYDEVRKNNLPSALTTLKSEARGMKDRRQMKRLFWATRRM